jgi:hypothetical protein
MQTARLGGLCTAVAAVSLLVAGCATVTSTPVTASDESNGLVYRLPQQHIAVTLTVSKDGPTLQVAPAAAFPDFGQPAFVLRTGNNAIAERKFVAEVDERGLLKSVHPTVTNKLSTTLQQIAKLSPMPRMMATENNECTQLGVYTRLLDPRAVAVDPDRSNDPSRAEPLCGRAITVTRQFSLAKLAPATTQRSGEQPGIYYRQQLPYLVRIDQRDFLVFSSSESPTYFLPLPRTVFSTFETTLTLSEGVLTKVDETANSEVLALLTLPADVLGAYFGAIGRMFGWRTSAATSEVEYLKAVASLSSERLRSQACLDAVQAGRPHDELRSICGLAN